MTGNEKKLRKLYQMGCDDNVFLWCINDADNDKKPSLFATPKEKNVFAMVYYGWLVALNKFNKKDFE